MPLLQMLKLQYLGFCQQQISDGLNVLLYLRNPFEPCFNFINWADNCPHDLHINN